MQLVRFKKSQQPATTEPAAPTSLKLPRSIALVVVAALVTLGVVVSFMESYRALYWWASGHKVPGVWAWIWPIQIDAFVAVGELALFVALVDVWHWRHRSLPWLIAMAGLTASVAGNVGHVATHNVFDRLTAAVPPLTAYVMLAASLGLLKRVVANAPAPVVAERKRPGPKPGSKRTPKAAEIASPEALKPLPAAEIPPFDDAGLFRPMVGAGAGPAGQHPQTPKGFDPDSTNAFPRLDKDGQIVKEAA